MHKVTVDVQDTGAVFILLNDVAVPDFFKD